MKRILLFAMLFLMTGMASAQSLLVGDANQDGKLSVGDVTQTANLVAGQTQTGIDLGSLAYKVDNTMVVGTWLIGQDVVTFSADGTTNYPSGATYKFRPFRGTLIVYDGTGGVVTILNVQEVTEDALVVSSMDGTVMSYSSTEPEVPDTHEYVDLGLPSHTLWATCNVGADNPEDYGLYFAWGETTGYTQDTSDGHSFDWSTYKYAIDNATTLTKYCSHSSYGYNGFTDSKTELDLSDDAAYVNWGSNWRMPSHDQQIELLNECTWTWTMRNGKNGYEVRGTNGNTLFLPAAGYRYDSSLDIAGSYGSYRSRTLFAGEPIYAHGMWFDSGFVDWYDGHCRLYGQSVRPVRVSQ